MKILMHNRKTEEKNVKYFFLLFLFIFFFFAQAVDASTIARPMNNAGLVGYWDFNVGKGGSTVYDRSGNSNDGTMTNMDSSTDWVDGKIGQGMDFDGVDDEMVFGSAPVTAMPLTICTWFYLYEVGTDQLIVAVNDGAVSGTLDMFGLVINSSNQLYAYQVRNGIPASIPNVGGLTSDIWYHACAVFTSLTDRRLYIDGVLGDTDLFSASSPPSGISQTRIGSGFASGTPLPFEGKIDETRIYNRALSSEEVKRLYNMTGPKQGVTPTVVSDGLVGHWTFDGPDMDWSSTTAEVLDRSGNGYNGDVTNFGSEAAVSGKIGQAFAFDGVNDSVDAGEFDIHTYNELTFALWIKPASTQKDSFPRLIHEASGTNGPALTFLNGITWGLGGSGQYIATGGGVAPAGEWTHVVATYVDNGASDALVIYINGESSTSGTKNSVNNAHTGTLRIGSLTPTSESFFGELDDVRIYNRALSANEVSRIYNATRPSSQNVTTSGGSLSSGLVGHWTFDGPDTDWSSTTAEVIDRSGNGYNGDATTSLTATSLRLGRIGQALAFDGIGDYINAGSDSALDNLGPLSVSFWLKLESDETDDLFITKGGIGEGSGQWHIGVRSATNNQIIFFEDWSGGNVEAITFNDVYAIGEWSHVVVSWNGEDNTDCIDAKIYVNSIDQTNTSACSVGGISRDDSSLDLFLGGWSSGNLIDGVMDDVRVYNRALTADEVKRLYNLGL